jgi:hypothetical protein
MQKESGIGTDKGRQNQGAQYYNKQVIVVQAHSQAK